MITLDSSGLYVLLDRKSKEHESALAALLADRGPYLLPAGILGEITYLVQRRLGSRVLDGLLADVESGEFVIHCRDEDIPRIRALVSRYADLPLAFADASVVACGERSGGRVLTLDRRDFDVIRREIPLELLP